MLCITPSSVWLAVILQTTIGAKNKLILRILVSLVFSKCFPVYFSLASLAFSCHDFLVFHFVFRLLFSLSAFSSSCSSSLLFSPLFFFLLSFFPLFFLSLFPLFFLSLFLLSFSPPFFFLPSVIMGHIQRKSSNTCQEPGPTEMSDGMRSTNICQKPRHICLNDGVTAMTMSMRHSGMVQRYLSETWPCGQG